MVRVNFEMPSYERVQSAYSKTSMPQSVSSNSSVSRTRSAVVSKFSNTDTSIQQNGKTKPTNVFYVWYSELCRRQNTSPISQIRPATLKNDRILDVSADRIKIEDWGPFFNALRLDTSLHVISIHSRLDRQKLIEEADTEEKIKKMKKWFGCICTKFVLKSLIRSLTSCMKNNTVLNYLELDGLVIAGEYLTSILKGMQQNKTIKYISFKNCPIGDEGCFDVCEVLHMLPNIEVLNLSSCNLTVKSGEYIAKLIKYQQINRYCESWHSSLRYEEPKVNNMAGIRRITLNSNPQIGDEGLEAILNELIDDLWIKALDMQRCNITEIVSDKILDTIECNRSLEVVDFRHNSLDPDTIARILEILKNKQSEDPDYQWCSTTTTLESLLETSRSTVRPVVSKSSKNISNKNSVLKRQATMPYFVRKTETSDNIKDVRQITQETNECLIKAKDQIMKLYEKLREETLKRQQAEDKCEELKKQMDELLSLQKNQTILKEFTNMKTYMNKFINFVKQHGTTEDHILIIRDLQNALEEVQVLSKPFEKVTDSITSNDDEHYTEIFDSNQNVIPQVDVQTLFQNLTGKPNESEDTDDLNLDLSSSLNQSSSSYIDMSDTARSTDSESETIRRLLEELTQDEKNKESSMEDLSDLSGEIISSLKKRKPKVTVKIPL